MILGDAPLVELADGRSVALGGVFDDAVTGMALLDADGRFRVVNAALCRMAGRRTEELVGLRPQDITHPEDRGRSETTLRSLLSGDTGTDQVRKRYLRADGTVVHVVRTTIVLRDSTGEVCGLFTQVVDISDAAEAQEALRRSEKRLQALMAHASELTVLVDRHGHIGYVSPASERLLGYRPDELQARDPLELIHPGDRERAAARFAGHQAASAPLRATEYRALHRDGSWRQVEVTTTNLFDDPDVGALVHNIRDVTDTRRYEHQLAASERRLRAIVGNSDDIITVHGRNGRTLFCSPAITSVLGYDAEELLGTDPLGLIHPDDVEAVTAFRHAADGGSPAAFQYRVRHKHGSWRWLESTARNRLADPAVAGIVLTSRDVTVRRRRSAQQEVVAILSGEAVRGGSVERLFRRATDLVAEVLEVERCTVLRAVEDKQLAVVTRHGPPLVEGRFCAEVDGLPVSLAAQALHDDASVVWSDGASASRPGPYPLLRQAGIRSGVAAVIADGGGLQGALTAYASRPDAFSRDDIAFVEAAANVLAAALGRRRVEDELRRRALHDNLTSLPNRVLLLDRLAGALGRLDRHAGSVAVLFVDTDDFKVVNDSLGHAAGDRVVTAVAQRITGVVRRTDVVARFGGDEFVVLCEDTDAGAAELVAEKIRRALSTPIDLDGRNVVVTASIGIAVGRHGAVSADDLLAQADTAMYAAKRAGKDRAVVFDLQMRRQVTEQLDKASGLRRALNHDELRLFYQPVVRSDTGTVVGAEALVRWEHPDQGLLGPDHFVGFAESSGLIVPMGAWVLEKACEQVAAWAALGFATRVSVNVSGRQLTEDDVARRVGALLDMTGIEPTRLQLEVTESAVMVDLDRVATVMEQVRHLGVQVGMDDFGTGYSSLSHLANLPFDFVKIDRSFIARFDQDRRAAALLQAIATLCRSLDLPAIAEGVETEEQLHEVRRLGIPYIQGFLFGRPVPAAAFPARRRLLQGARD